MLSKQVLLIAIYLGLAAAQCGPSGAHIQSGTAQCSCSGNHISCDPFQICGVGHTDANVLLTASCTATVTCTNRGGNTVEVKSQPVTVPSRTVNANARNGCVNIPSIQLTEPSNSQFEAAASCPNPNWTKSVKSGSTSCTFSETVTFEGCNTPFTTVQGSCSA
ncbi:uncharacterized protein P174DRAFT_365492 [Aspergillus novofumigatus IBT 16806]|uniref:Uncharacterized protein n=1 Tax=Aspergillus novofumigatus (strain IBT 16806) TaxID=1392255 RepID=A0A2I1CF96_ASPN1|nr:uncharacterized protein P174DRAFT_365492 [Aspergillus novofumigatus IBT 16806]PKX96299.1 hypothetical protein P174DRAFT_365492 [Aspergillus novofumigatus IBT 16806]